MGSGKAERLGASSVQVLDTRERGEDIVLVCDGQVPQGAEVTGVLNWQYRFDRMQNHSGEHIVSGLIHRKYGCNNVGFHMSEDRMTIDLDGEITREGLREIEEEANAIVWQNQEISTAVYTEAEAEKVDFRSKKELHGAIRVVTIPGADVCACCGTHVKHTGEIGSIRLIAHERFKGGVRIEMMCGRWAYNYMTRIFDENHEVSRILSARPTETGSAAAKAAEDANRMKYQIIQMNYERIDRKAAELTGKGNVLIFARDFNPVLVQKLAARVMETCGGTVIAMSGASGEGYKYAAGEVDGNLKELIQGMNRSLNGRGGGKPFFQQGSISAEREEAEAYLRGKLEGLTVCDLE